MGGIAVPASMPRSRRGAPRLRAIVADATPRLALTASSLLPRLAQWWTEMPEASGVELLGVEEVVPEPGQAVAASPPGAAVALASSGRIAAGELAFLQYTSGSTSTPKGVMVTHANLLHNSAALEKLAGHGRDSVGATWLPNFHDMGLIYALLQPVYSGFHAYVMSPASFVQHPRRWLEVVSRYQVTHSGGPNFAYDLCVSSTTPGQRAALDLSSWRFAFCGAEPIRRQTVEGFAAAFAASGFRRQAFHPGYGLAEATLTVSCGNGSSGPQSRVADSAALEEGRFREVAGAEHGAPGTRSLVASGTLADGMRVEIVDPASQRAVEPGRIGEIWVAGGSVAAGYWRNPEESARVFGARLDGDEARASPASFLRTGDLGFLWEDQLYVTGRLKDLLIIRGRNHYPQDLEQTVEGAHPALRAAGGAAFSVEVDGEERLVVAHEVEREERRPDVAAIADAVRMAVSEEHDLRLYSLVLLRVGTLPKTSSGKVQRSACRQGFLAGTLAIVGEWREEATAPPPAAPPPHRAAERDPAHLRAWIAGRLAERLKVDPARIDPEEPWARYGVDSVLAVSLAGDIAEKMGEELPPTLLYDHPTIAGLAAHLAGTAPVPAPPRRPEERLGEPVAVVGIGCRFPGAAGPQGFWRLLRDGVDAIGEVPDWRWDREGMFDPDPLAPGKMTTRWGGFVEEVDGFDAALFGISPREAESMDPQQRLLLEVAWEALEDAAMAPESLRGSATGIFVGISTDDYGRLRGGDLDGLDAYGGTGAARSIAANRLSYYFDFRGPSLAVDTACSSALVAVHLACQSLRRGECEIALAGGVNVILDPGISVVFSKAGLLAPDGRCKVFDEAADGYVRSEGCGLVVLAPLSRALDAGLPVYAVLRGSAVNQDGRSNGLTAPSRAAQEEVLRAAYRDAGVDPSRVDYVEAHGTGTALGDPIEAHALGAVVGEGRDPDRPCAVGSAKSNLGHTEAAAGIAGLIKVALALAEGEIPASLHYRRPNPRIPFPALRLRVQDRLAPWPAAAAPALAGVSSFGFGGSNAHAVLEAAPAREPAPAAEPAPRAWQILPLAAATPGALAASRERLAGHLASAPPPSLADVGLTLAAGRRRFPLRAVALARDPGAAAAVLRGEVPERLLTLSEPVAVTRVAFMLPGVGDHYPGMAAGLYAAEPVFRAVMDECAEILRPLLGADLRAAIWSAGSAGPSGAGVDLRRMLGRGGAAEGLTATSLAQPAIFAVDYALARLWMSWGIAPAALIGHSLGEYVAACLAGVLPLADALLLVARRAAMIEELAPGAMLAVSLSEEELGPWLAGAPELSLAAVNAPGATVVSGSPEAVADLEQRLAAGEIASRRLRASRAFHSRLLEPLRGPLTRLVEQVELRPPALPCISNVTGAWLTAEQATDPAYWAEHMCATVRFAAGLATLLAEPEQALLEVGPGQALGSFALQQKATGPARLVVSSLRPEFARDDDLSLLLASLGRLWLAGVEPDWRAVYGERARLLHLPTYPFEHRRFWSTPRRQMPAAPEPPAGRFYRPVWRRAGPPAAVETSPAGRNWLVFLDERGVGDELLRLLVDSGERAWGVRAGESFAAPEGSPGSSYRIAPGSRADYAALIADLLRRQALPERIAHLWSVNGGASSDFDAAQARGFHSLVFLASALAGAGAALPASVAWTVFSDGLWRLAAGEPQNPEKSTLLGPCLVIPQEHPGLRCRSIDLDAGGEPPLLARQALAELRAGGTEHRLALRGGERWVQDFEPVRLAAPASPLEALRRQGVYLLTGGLGQVGLALAESLARQAQARLVLVGRSGLPPVEEWDACLEERGGEDPVCRRIAAVRRLESLGAEVLVCPADVADREAMRRAVEAAHARFGALHGVVHAAGVVAAGAFQAVVELSPSASEVHFRPKARGLQVLDEVLAGQPLDFCLLASSISSVLGGLGFAAYSAANLFLDAFASAKEDGRRWLSVDWDRWRPASAAAPAGGAPGLRGTSLDEVAMDPDQGRAAFERLLSSGLSGQVVQSTGDLAARRAGLARLMASPQPAAAAPPRSPESPAKPGSFAATGALERRIAELWQEALRVPAVGLHDNFFDLGGNSLIGVELIARLRRELGAELSNMALFEAPTVAALARRLGDAATAVPAPFEPPPAVSPRPAGREVAIVGMAGRFPGAVSVEELRRALAEGRETIRFFSDEELRAAGVDAATLARPGYVRARPVLEGIDLFDAQFFGFNPREAAAMDPQQRLFLETAWTALEDAGYNARRDGRPVGVFVGSSLSSYLLGLYADPAVAASLDPFQMVIGNDKDSLPTSVSYRLDLKGPSLAVQTHCSTSLVAVHLACQSLLAGECDLALAGGVSVRVPSHQGHLHQEGGQESPDGHCRPFDRAAAGTLFGDAVAAVVLKRLDDALADGDTIRAVIKGSAINNDGSNKIGYTAPSIEGQSRAVRAALANAAVDPATIGFVEAHGSGTRLGDPIEVAALNLAYGRGAGPRTCVLGSLKSNLGHLDRASGVTGLIKATLALEEGRIPATLHFRSPNPEIDFSAGPFFVSAEPQGWPLSSGTRRAAVNSLGMGGTNAHVVLEGAPAAVSVSPARRFQVLPISAKSPAALEAASANLATHLRRQEDAPAAELADVAFTLQQGRQVFPHRRVVVAESCREAATALESLDSQRVWSALVEAENRPVAFMFPGLGDQHGGFGRELYAAEPGFRERVDRCCEGFAPYVGDLRPSLFAAAAVPAAPGMDLRRLLGRGGPAADDRRSPLRDTALAQPALFTLSYALAGLWMDWGIVPRAMIGYSLGEYVAACIAGVLSLPDALALVALRARRIAALPAGDMLAVPLAEAAAAAWLGEGLSLAAVNGPALSVLSGTPQAIADCERRLREAGVSSQRLATTHAFHSAMMEPLRGEIVALVQGFALRPPAIPYVSNVTGTWITPAQATDPEYWAAHTCGTVRFEAGLKELARQDRYALLEVGPGQALTSAALQARPDAEPLPAIPSQGHRLEQRSEVSGLLGAVGRLWLEGVEIDWAALSAGERRRRRPLPTYPFERQRYWIDTRRGLPTGAGPAPGEPVKDPDLGNWFYAPTWRQAPLPPKPSGKLSGSWLIFADARGIGEELGRRIEEEGGRVARVVPGPGFAAGAGLRFRVDPADPSSYQELVTALRETGDLPATLVHLWTLPATAAEAAPSAAAAGAALDRRLDLGFYSLLHLAQAFGRLAERPAVRWVVAGEGLCDVLGEGVANPVDATLLGPVKVIPREHPNLDCRAVDLPPGLPAGESASLLLHELGAGGEEGLVAWRGRRRLCQEFAPVHLPPPAGRPVRLREGGVYLITGGLGGLGLTIADYLAREVRARLVLVGRTALPPRETWAAWREEHGEDDSQSRRMRQVEALEAAGAEVLAAAADVADRAAMVRLVAEVVDRFGAVHGVVHAAGLPGEGLIQRKERAQAARVLAPKVHGTLALEEALAGQDLDFRVLFSSTSSITGGLGEVDYCAANLFLDAYAHAAEALGGPFTVALNWGPWQWDAWQDAALAALPELRDRLRRLRAELGISPAEGQEAFARALAGAHSQLAVVPQGLPALLRLVAGLTAESLADLAVTGRAGKPRFARPRIKHPYEPPASDLEARLAEVWQELLGIEQVGVEDPFFELGGNSLIGIEMISRLGSALAVELSLADLFEAPTVRRLAAQVEERAGAHRPAPQVSPADRGLSLPLSFAQERHWFLHQLDPLSALYHVAGAVELRGDLDAAAFLQAIALVVARHEVLRTTFPPGPEGGPTQRISPEARFGMGCLDLAGLAAEAAEREARGVLRTEVRRPFDLVLGPLLRAQLIRLADQRHWVVVTMHHIVSDFWSIGIFTSEVSAAYAALVRGRRPELPVLPLQYAEYARWQQDWLRGPVLEDLLAYWRGHLLGASPQLALPLDRPRTAEPRFAGARQPLRFGRSLTAGLKELARATDSSLFVVLAAAFALLLKRWTGQDDLSFGTPVANRDRLPVGQLVGCFINAVALRIDLSGDPSFQELLGRTRQTAQAAFAHQDLPFEKLVAALNPARQQSHWPLFQVVFNYQSASLPPLELPGLAAEYLDVESDMPTKYDLTFYLREEEEEVLGSLAYQTGLFDPGTARWLADSYERLLHGIVATPTERLSRYELAAENSGGERRVAHSSRLAQVRRRAVWVGAAEEPASPGDQEKGDSL